MAVTIKSEREIELMKEACKLTALTYDYIEKIIKPGMSTLELDNLAEKFIKSNGGKPAWYRNGFPGAVCISVNDEVIHGLPSKKRIIRKGDLVSIDAGIDLDGYISDSTHTVLIGEVDPKVKKLKDWHAF